MKLQALPAQGRVPSCIPCKIVKKIGGLFLGCLDARELPLGQAAHPLSKPRAQFFYDVLGMFPSSVTCCTYHLDTFMPLKHENPILSYIYHAHD